MTDHNERDSNQRIDTVQDPGSAGGSGGGDANPSARLELERLAVEKLKLELELKNASVRELELRYQLNQQARQAQPLPERNERTLPEKPTEMPAAEWIDMCRTTAAEVASLNGSARLLLHDLLKEVRSKVPDSAKWATSVTEKYPPGAQFSFSDLSAVFDEFLETFDPKAKRKQANQQSWSTVAKRARVATAATDTANRGGPASASGRPPRSGSVWVPPKEVFDAAQNDPSGASDTRNPLKRGEFLTNLEKLNWMLQSKCFRCAEVGHKASKCPTKKGTQAPAQPA
ncbi:hypothetical protein HYH03_014242 [Edaphochlamys debaryana]|uniref:CCHC-type domain-containing protein n=1 Tax=Edaphochlamys debaryana TaxID=47281 RepID=A0A835XWM3_9CHLO|nr:hypothetical protein HYH03_014242 [Edaphochlamys debaryana]|eukprot:KAG2487129.1 hypothetical protein HYH03_014242 [Edaphochlamys debaryana]